ncbi:hypothetical protein PATSB16_08420 [Pandoraea thiooxydans]|nr:hypothetical protein PATSB16_08420 [Pandoraea thiooxydans]
MIEVARWRRVAADTVFQACNASVDGNLRMPINSNARTGWMYMC